MLLQGPPKNHLYAAKDTIQQLKTVETRAIAVLCSGLLILSRVCAVHAALLSVSDVQQYQAVSLA